VKQVILIISILIIIIGGTLYASMYISKSSSELIGKLQELRKEINSGDAGADNSRPKQNANTIYDKWEKTSKSWSIIILHNELDLIETSLVSMKTNIETGDKNKALEELDKSVDLLNHIVEKETFSFRNVF